MCGFLGAYTFKDNIAPWLPKLLQGLERIGHRGPDAGKHVTSENTFSGHRRLSIIDLSSNADNPLFSSHVDAHIIFNGEIYNYRDLKASLRQKVDFKTTSDTEVILEGYLQEGADFFTKLRGIYAFAIYDYRGRAKKIILARDPSGVKPLYYCSNADLLVFGSELKALLPSVRERLTINENAVKAYLNLSYVPEPFTVYNEIVALEPGSLLTVDEGGINRRVFYSHDFKTENNLSFSENVEIVEEKLRLAVNRNLVADVEVAVALSGGIDSSLIYAYANDKHSQIKGLSARFTDGDYDESTLATSYARALKGKQIIFDIERDFSLEVLDKILIHFDQPYADSSAIPVYYLTKKTAAYTKVIIGGDGGDELFNGYPSQTRLANIHRYKSNPLMSLLMGPSLRVVKSLSRGERKRGIQRAQDIAEDNPAEMLYDWHSWFPRKTRFDGGTSPFTFDTHDGLALYHSCFSNREPEDFPRQIVFDYFMRNMLSDYLRKTDMMSMMNHVEYRVPFLDEDLVSFALSIPFWQKSNSKETKKVLRALHSRVYPAETSNAPKHGFSIPLDVYLSREEFARIGEALMSKDSYVSHFIRSEYIQLLFAALKGERDVSTHISRSAVYQRILMLYSLDLWHKNS